MLEIKIGEKQAKIVNFCMFLIVQMEDKFMRISELLLKYMILWCNNVV